MCLGFFRLAILGSGPKIHVLAEYPSCLSVQRGKRAEHDGDEGQQKPLKTNQKKLKFSPLFLLGNDQLDADDS